EMRGNDLPPIQDAVNQFGLAVFLASNILTGLVNLTVDTLHSSNFQAFCVLSVYLALVCGIALGLDVFGRGSPVGRAVALVVLGRTKGLSGCSVSDKRLRPRKQLREHSQSPKTDRGGRREDRKSEVDGRVPRKSHCPMPTCDRGSLWWAPCSMMAERGVPDSSATRHARDNESTAVNRRNSSAGIRRFVHLQAQGHTIHPPSLGPTPCREDASSSQTDTEYKESVIMKICGACVRELPDDSYSVEQSRLRQSIRRCEECVAASNQLVLLMKKGRTSLGNQYRFGRNGLEENITRAVELYERAAELGVKEAHNMLGGLYANGYKVEKNMANAFQYLTSTKLGDVPSLNCIKKMFMARLTTKDDYAAALRGYQITIQEMSSPDRSRPENLLNRAKIIF
ncbi:hypothetical protein THAOC_03107, partial [Thalassiosira oceanica]